MKTSSRRKFLHLASGATAFSTLSVNRRSNFGRRSPGLGGQYCRPNDTQSSNGKITWARIAVKFAGRCRRGTRLKDYVRLCTSLTYSRCRRLVDVEGTAVIKRVLVGRVPQACPRARVFNGSLLVCPLRFKRARQSDFKH
jgi:hypothetical protein